MERLVDESAAFLLSGRHLGLHDPLICRLFCPLILWPIKQAKSVNNVLHHTLKHMVTSENVFFFPTNSLQKPQILYICCIYVSKTKILAKCCNRVIGANDTPLVSKKLWVWHFVAKEINQGCDQQIKSIIWFSTVAAGLWPASTGLHDPYMIVRNCVMLCAGSGVRDYFKATASLREIWFALPH